MVVVHASDKSSVVSDDPLDLARVLKLEFVVQVFRAPHGPIVLNGLVDPGAIGPDFTARPYLLKEKVSSVLSLWFSARHEFVGEFPRSYLLSHDECHVSKERFIQLHNTLENMGFFRQVTSKEPIPMPDRFFREVR